MKLFYRLLKVNFEYRVIISYIIFGFALISLIFSKNYAYKLIASQLGISIQTSMTITFLIIGIVNLLTWIFRSYAGGFLSGHIAVTKEVQTKTLVTSGPYAHVRNPLYLSDIISMTIIGFAGPPIAILILFLGKVITSYLYIIYEEKELSKEFKIQYQDYLNNVPRLIPKFLPYGKPKKVKINWKEGLAYNFYALGIGVAFIIAAFTQNRNHLYIFGFITPALWFFLRFIDRHIRK